MSQWAVLRLCKLTAESIYICSVYNIIVGLCVIVNK